MFRVFVVALVLVLALPQQLVAQPRSRPNHRSAAPASVAPALDSSPSPAPGALVGASLAPSSSSDSPLAIPPSSASPPPEASPEPSPSPVDLRPAVLVVDAYPIGVDPAAATFVTTTLRQAAERFGYVAIPVDRFYAYARTTGLPYPTPAAALHMAVHGLGARVGITADVRGGNGYYFVTIRVRFPNEMTERTRTVVATQWTLGSRLQDQAGQMLAGPPTLAVSPTVSPYGTLPSVPVVPPRRPVRLHRAPVDLAAGVEFPVGFGADGFFIVLAYVRGSWFPSDRIGVTASVAYANLPAVNRRVSNVLPMLGVEGDLEISGRHRVYLPVRAEVGYVPINGAVLRGTAGVVFPLSRHLRLELDVLVPTVWYAGSTALFSMNFGVQLITGIGAPPRRRRRPRQSPESAEASSPAPSAAP